METILAAERFDGIPQSLDHTHESKRSDVGMRFAENLFRRARLDELAQDLAAEKARILDLAIELAVRKGAGSALAELNVRFRVENGFRRENPPGRKE